MVRRGLLSSIVLFAACSPAPPPEVKSAVATPPAKPPAPAEQTHARWLLNEAIGKPTAELDLGDKGVLQVGRGGRRWRVGRDGAVEASSFLLATDLIDVRRSGDKFLILGVDGTVYVVDDALGPAKSTRPSPSKDATFAAAHDALLGVDPDGTLHRSTDGGATWKKSGVGVPKGDTAVSIAADARGEVLLLSHPQRMLVSNDDGATFAPLATPGIGATFVRRDAKDDLWLRSEMMNKDAKLLGGPLRLEVATTFVEPTAPKTDASIKKPKNEPRKQLVGSRLVTLAEESDATTKRKKIEINVAPLAGGDTPNYVLVGSGSSLTRVHLAGHENIVVAGVYDPDAEPRGIKLFRTTDDGKNWEPVGLIEGSEDVGFRIAAAPGVIVIGGTCGVAPPCMPARMKVGTKDWKPLGIPADARFGALAFDADRDRMFVLTVEDSGTAVYAAKRGDALKKIETNFGKGTPRAATVDKEGTLRVAFSPPWRIEKIGSDLKVRPASYLPFEPKAIDLSSERGYAWTQDHAWETADGGERWASVPSGANGSVACASTGCLQGGAVRLGWDLPNPSATLIASTATPTTGSSGKPVAVPAAGPPLEATCKVTGPWKPYTGDLGITQRGGLDGNVRFVATIFDEGFGTIRGVTVARGAAPPTQFNLLGAAPKETASIAVRHSTDMTSRGIVVARYTFSLTPPKDPAPDGARRYNPVDTELAWYSSATGKVHKTTLPKVKPFRVGRTSPGALVEIVEGGLLFLPLSGEAPMYFVNNAGKVQTFPRPPSSDDFGFSAAVKNGNQLVLTENRGEDTVLTISNDAGKTWASSVWTTGESATLNAIDGKATLVLGNSSGGGTPAGMLPFTSLTPDPPLAVRWAPPAAKSLVACTKPGVLMPAGLDDGSRVVHITVSGDTGPMEFSTHAATLRGGADGSTCVDLVVAHGEYEPYVHQLFVSPADPTHGWFTREKEPEKFEARPITCTLP